MHLKTKYKLRLLIIIMLLLIILFFIYLFVPKNYTSLYKYKNYTIKEKYNKKNKLYEFTITKDKNNYLINIKHKYTNKRHLIKKITSENDCIKIYIFDYTRSICVNNGIYEVSYLNNNINNKILKTYKNINIYDYNDKLFYIWNYSNFVIISNDKLSTMKLFKNDYYQLDYITSINNSLVLADYDNEYFFKKFIIINTKKRSYTSKNLKRELSFDGYILGTSDNYIYLYDSHYEKSFKYNPFKNAFYNTDNKLYVDGKWQDISINKLNKQKYYFTYDNNYFISENKLYFNDNGINVLVFPNNIDRIVCQDSTSAYFISDSKLYYNNYFKENKLLLSFSEWKFNNKNIYIFDN